MSSVVSISVLPLLVPFAVVVTITVVIVQLQFEWAEGQLCLGFSDGVGGNRPHFVLIEQNNVSLCCLSSDHFRASLPLHEGLCLGLLIVEVGCAGGGDADENSESCCLLQMCGTEYALDLFFDFLCFHDEILLFFVTFLLTGISYRRKLNKV